MAAGREIVVKVGVFTGIVTSMATMRFMVLFPITILLLLLLHACNGDERQQQLLKTNAMDEKGTFQPLPMVPLDNSNSNDMYPSPKKQQMDENVGGNFNNQCPCRRVERASVGDVSSGNANNYNDNNLLRSNLFFLQLKTKTYMYVNCQGEECDEDTPWYKKAWKSTVNGVKYASGKVVDGATYAGGKVVDGATYAGGKVVDGAKYAGGKVVDGAKYVGGKVVDGTKYVGGKVVDGAKYVGGKVADGAAHVSDKVFGARDERGNPAYEGTGSQPNFSPDKLSLAMIAIMNSYSESPPKTDKLKELEKITAMYEGNLLNSKFAKFFSSESAANARVKIYKDINENCYVAYRGSQILHDWVVNAKVNGADKDTVLLAKVIGAVSPAAGVKFLGKSLLRGDYENENKQCVHRGFFEHMKLSLDEVLEKLNQHQCTPTKTICVGHSLGGATATNAAAIGVCKELYTIGAPRAFCNKCPEKLREVESFRFVNAYRYNNEAENDYEEL